MFTLSISCSIIVNMKLSDIPKTWKIHKNGGWRRPYKVFLWSSRAKTCKKEYLTWIRYFQGVCIGCGDDFVDPRKTAKYCSNMCNNSNNKQCGEKHRRWRGGRCDTTRGYVLIRTGYKKYKFEHIVLMEKKIKRKLVPGVEVVHHINGVKNDNRLSNLIIMTRAQHASHHAKERADL